MKPKTESVRIPKNLMEIMRKAARENGRTIQGEISRILWSVIKAAKS